MLETLAQIFADYVDIDPAQVKPENYFSQDLGFNSYDFMSMLAEVEDEIGVKIPETALGNMFKVEDLISFIAEHKGE